MNILLKYHISQEDPKSIHLIKNVCTIYPPPKSSSMIYPPKIAKSDLRSNRLYD